MSKFYVAQWSDLHFANSQTSSTGLTPARAVEAATEAIRLDYPSEQLVLLLTGDITTQGAASGYSQASVALGETKKALGPKAIIVCPGNHDIARVEKRAFIPFNNFAFALTNDPSQYWNEKQAVSVVHTGDAVFIAVNSAHEGDHSFGSVPLNELRQALEATRHEVQIVALHHSPISSQYAGGGMADAYDLLALISEFEVSAVLHGHVHSDQGLLVGPYKTLLFGAGSLGFEPDPNMNNQFVVHEFKDGHVANSRIYKYLANQRKFGA